MPLYFAYGVNMSPEAMAGRCAGAKYVGVAKLMRHRFVITPEGWGSVERDMSRLVYGVLWDVSFGHVRTLDVFEEIGRGLYTKATQPVLKLQGGGARALIYFGHGAQGRACAGYMEDVIASARHYQFPDSYIRELENLLPKGGAVQNAAVDASITKPHGAVAQVRPRFATPFDRRDT